MFGFGKKRERPADSSSSGVLERLSEGLGKTRRQLFGGLGQLFRGRARIDDDLMEEIETQLLSADVGVKATQRIMDDLTAQVDRKTVADPASLQNLLESMLADLLQQVEKPLEISDHKPAIVLVVGVNGVGKTTTIGKLAHHFRRQGQSVMLAAGDTFRAAAVEQLQAWGERNDVPVVAQHTGADSASVIYDAVQAAQSRGTDVLIADTAGRLHNKSNLMEELAKVTRVMQKLSPDAPHEVLLVLDAGTGQNALAQAREFNATLGVTGLVLTKMDGTAKGGVIFALAEEFGIPVRFVGVGEQADDLRPFVAEQFASALFGHEYETTETDSNQG